MVFAIYTPQNNTSNPPSMAYTYVGNKDVSHDIADSIATCVPFKDKADFNKHMKDIDNKFFNQ